MVEPKQVVFKKKVRIFDRRSVFFSIITAAMFLSLIILIMNCRRSCQRVGPWSGSQSGWSTDQDEEYANKLASKGLKNQAAVAYQDYLNTPGLAPQRRAKICYRIAELYTDMTEYEKALAFLYRVDRKSVV